MTRRNALTAVAAAMTATGWPVAAQAPYGPYGPAADYRILDLATVREIIVRLPKGNITLQTEEIWAALQRQAEAP